MDPAPAASTGKALAAAALLFVLGDTLLFRWSTYAFFAKPDSSGGWAALRIVHDEMLLPKGPVTIAAFGDSRLGEAFADDQLVRRWPGAPITLRPEFMPGSTPRVWSFLLDRLDPARDRYRLILVALADYDDRDGHEELVDRTLDLHFLPPLARLSDTAELVRSFDAPAARHEALLTSLCKTYAFRRDLQDFAASPLQRYRDVRTRLGQFRWGSPYGGIDGSLAGARIEGDLVVDVPATAPPDTAERLRQLALAPPPEDRGRTRAYRRLWLGRIAGHAGASGAQVVFLRMPTQVLPPRQPRPPFQPVLDELAQQPHVHVLDRDLFAALERPELFRDALHLNRHGRALFTVALGDELWRRLGPALAK